MTLSAVASDSDGTVTRVDFFDGATLVGTDATAPYSVTWSDAGAGAHSLTAVAFDNQLASGTSPVIPISAQEFPGWLHQDVGAVGAAGGASYSAGAFSVVASGADIAASADEFHFVYVPVSGNATIVARVAAIQNTSAWAKGGVMLRESLAANSRHASMFLTRANGLQFQRRTTTGGFHQNVVGPLVSAPHWVKLVRSGATFTGWASPDGAAWTFVGSATFTMPSNLYVGLALTSRNDGVLNTSVFDNVFLLTDSANASPTLAVSSPVPGSVFPIARRRIDQRFRLRRRRDGQPGRLLPGRRPDRQRLDRALRLRCVGPGAGSLTCSRRSPPTTSTRPRSPRRSA